jgi:tryptophan halogenase
MNKKISIGIIGSGTAGLLSAIMFRNAFPHSDITVISSSDIGIIGVGEGSTEHWKEFMKLCDIPLFDMLSKTGATHKYGIRFENWSKKFPDYFHSVSGDETLYAYGLYPTYSGFVEQEKTLTSQTASVGLVQDKLRRQSTHDAVNQFHFDTFKLNRYFSELCFNRSIRMIDGEVEDINIESEFGTIESVTLKDGSTFSADFWVDATGFKKAIISKVSDVEWNSFSEYLCVDSAIAFPSEADENGKIKPYTRARAMSSGWMWEIPTQERRGNGYVFSSKFISLEEAIAEASKAVGFDVKPAKVFKFDPGHLKKPWVKNCAAIGLSASFVEPLEATSIGSTIQQIKWLIPSVANYKKTNQHMQEFYNKQFNLMMDNILSMIRLHYMTDRDDTPFWKHAASRPVNQTLQEYLNLWSERTPSRYDIPSNNGEMFLSSHMIHVAQGQNLLNAKDAGLFIDNMCLRDQVKNDMSEKRLSRNNHELVDHKEALMELYEIWE